MPQISQYVTAPYQGVSQAAPQVRLPENADAIENAMVIIPQGAIKRPPLTWQGKLNEHPGDNNGIFAAIGREASNLFLTITDEAGTMTPRLYDLSDFPMGAYDPDGVDPLPLTISVEAQAYLDTGAVVPSRDLRVLTVADYTFITNTLVTVDKVATTAPVRLAEAMLWVKQAAYGRTYEVVVSPSGGTPVTVTLVTPNGTAATDAPWVDTDTIAASLVSGSYTAVNGASITGNLSGLSGQGFTVTVSGAVIYLQRATGNFTMEVKDGQGGVALIAIKDKVTTVSELPPRGVSGFVVRVSQNSASVNDDYFLTFITTAGANTGVWTESLGSGAELGLDPETMPMGLVNPGSGWELDVLPWQARTVGDEDLAPDPDFVGRTISDVTYWRGRLVIVSGEGVALSSAETPFRFYPSTLSSVIDSDSVTLLSPTPEINNLRYGIPFDERLIVFGDKAQNQVTSDGPLTPDTARIDAMTSYEFNRAIKPQSSNGKLYFTGLKGAQASAVYELQVDKVASVTDAQDLTTSVPRYVPAAIDRVANCPINYLMLYGQSGEQSLYAHLFRYADGQRVQNAWMQWTLPDVWLNGGMFFLNTTGYILLVDGAEAHLVAIDTAPDVLDDHADATLLTHLDMRCKETQCVLAYDAPTDRTLVTLPYEVATAIAFDALKIIVRAPGGNGGVSFTEDGPPEVPEGFPADIDVELTEDEDPNQVVLKGDWTDAPLWFGIQYTMRIQLSRFYSRGQDGMPLLSGRLSIVRMNIDVADTGYLQVRITAKGRTARTYTYSGYVYDDPGSQYGTPPATTGTIAIPVSTQNTQLTAELLNSSHFPSKVVGLEWRGRLNLKAGGR